jgi:hypothetical protein
MKEPCVGSDSAIEEGTHAEMIPHILKQANQVKIVKSLGFQVLKAFPENCQIKTSWPSG